MFFQTPYTSDNHLRYEIHLLSFILLAISQQMMHIYVIICQLHSNKADKSEDINFKKTKQLLGSIPVTPADSQLRSVFRRQHEDNTNGFHTLS